MASMNCKFAIAGAMQKITACLDSTIFKEDLSAAEFEQDIPVPLKYPTKHINVLDSYMAYYEAGDPDGPVIILQHGVPTWGYMWRNIVPLLASRGRIICPDLIGFGRSGKPDSAGDPGSAEGPPATYRLDMQIKYFKGFIDAMGLKDVIIFGHDWGGILGQLYTAENPENVRAFGWMEQMVLPFKSFDEIVPSAQQLFKYLRTPEAEERMRATDFIVEAIMLEVSRFKRDSPEMWFYRQPFPTPESGMPCLYLARDSVVAGKPEDNATRIEAGIEKLKQSSVPLFCLAFKPGFIMPFARIPEFKKAFPRLEVKEMDYGKHFVSEEHPTRIAAAIDVWLAKMLAPVMDANSQTFEMHIPLYLELPSKHINVLDSYMAYYEAGDPEGQVIILQHGVPTWGYMWRNIVPLIESRGRIIVPDLIGFGRSGKPDVDFRLDSQMKYFKGFIDAMGLKDVIIFGHDWGGILGQLYTAENSDNVKGFGWMEQMVMPFPKLEGVVEPSAVKLFKYLRTPEAEDKMLKTDFIVEAIMKEVSRFDMNSPEMWYYREPFPTPKSGLPCLYLGRDSVVAGQPSDNATRINAGIEKLKQSTVPLLCLSFTPGFIMPPGRIPEFKAAFPRLEVKDLGYGKHFVSEEHPTRIGAAIDDWLNNLLGEEMPE